MPDSQLTVMQVIPRLDAGGAERTTLEINKALVESGWRSLVVSSGGRYADSIAADGGTHITLPVHSKNPIQIALNGRALSKIARSHGVNIIHARSRAPAWSCLNASRKTGLPFVTTYHGAYKARGTLKRHYNSVMVRSTRVIANSHFTASQIIKTYKDHDPALAKRMHVIHRGADLTRFDPATLTEQRVEQATQGWDITPSSLTGPRDNGDLPVLRLLLPARMSRWKGHEIAIKAVKSIAGSGQDGILRLIFCGGRSDDGHVSQVHGDTGPTDQAIGSMGSLERELRDMVLQFGIGDLIHFSGYCEDMPAALGWADGVIVPSTRPEAFGRVAVEAGAMGVPVLASNHGGAKETILGEKTGLLFTPDDSEALAGAIKKFQKMGPEGRAKLGTAAKTHIQNNFSVHSMCGNTLALYKDVLADHGISHGAGADDAMFEQS